MRWPRLVDSCLPVESTSFSLNLRHGRRLCVLPRQGLRDEQLASPGTYWSPSSMIHRMGREINNEDSICYWAWKNDIPLFCPAITDGSIGDMIYFHSYQKPGLIVDIAQDIRALNDLAIKAKHSGMLLLGGGPACCLLLATCCVLRTA